MTIVQTIQDRRNKILVAAAAGVGLIVAIAVGVNNRTPAYQVENSSGVKTWEVLGDGSQSGSGDLLIGSGSKKVRIRANGSLNAQGTMSGNHLYAGTMSGAGLTDCDTAATSKLLWDATTQRYSCGTDQDSGGGGGAFTSTGSLQVAFDKRYVNESGDGMTGALAIRVGSAKPTAKPGLAFEWYGTASGSKLYATTLSGALLYGAGLSTCSGTQKPQWASGIFSCVTDDDNQNLFETIAVSGQSDIVADSATDTLTIAAGANITLTTTAGTDTLTIAAAGGGSGFANLFGTGANTKVAYFTGLRTLSGATTMTWNDTTKKLNIAGTASGKIMHAEDQLLSSGSLAVRGAAHFYSTLKLNAITYTFPFGDGTASGKVLGTNGAGQLSWMNNDLSSVNKTAAYTARAGELVMADAATTAGFQVTLPNAPATSTRVGVKMTATSGTRTVRVAGAQNIQDRETSTGSVLLYVKGDYIELEYDGSLWQVVSEGRIPHKARLTRDAAQSIAASTEVKVAVDAETYDVGQIGDFSTNDRVDIRRPGKYMVRVFFGFSLDATEQMYAEIYKNEALVTYGAQTAAAEALTLAQEVHKVLNLSTGDRIEAYLFHSNAMATNTDTAESLKPVLEVTELFP